MPVAYIDIPTGVNDGAKRKIFDVRSDSRGVADS